MVEKTLFDLTGKNAIVTGASSGIGAALAAGERRADLGEGGQCAGHAHFLTRGNEAHATKQRGHATFRPTVSRAAAESNEK